MTPKTIYDKMSLEQLQELFELEQELRMAKQDDVLSRLLETAILIHAKKRRGKTLSGVAVAYQLREQYDRPVIALGSKMGLGEGAGGPDAFGPYQNMPERDFKEEMEKLNVAVSEEENADQVASVFKRHHINIYKATVVMDEARKLLNSRRPMDKLVQLVGDFVMQSAHYHCTVIILAPAEKEIDQRVVNQLDWKGRCFHNAYTNICHVRLVQGLEVLSLDIDGADDTYHTPYYDMYNSWNILGYRPTSLDIKRL